MCSNNEVIKFVAGGGKTTYSRELMLQDPGGIYLAYNRMVVDDIARSGVLSKTIDAFFTNYILPKIITVIPLLKNIRKIEYIETKTLPKYLKNVSTIKINKNGVICNGEKETPISLNDKFSLIKEMGNFKNSKAINYIIETDILRLTDSLRSDLALYVLSNYKDKIVYFITSRFRFVVIDEAQDLSGYRELFAKMLFESNIELILLGDELQDIYNKECWFETLEPNQEKNISYRCSEGVCEWIRTNLEVEIHGVNGKGFCNEIKFEEVKKLDDGNRVLLYYSENSKISEIISKWNGPKSTIKNAKGTTINEDIVLIGGKMNKKNIYTAVTRTTRNVYSTVKLK